MQSRPVIGETEHETLMRLAEGHMQKNPAVADLLLQELDRASVVSDRDTPRGRIRMGSVVEFSTDGSALRRAILVYPGEADIEAGKISILTPVGAALIGLQKGDTARWSDANGRSRVVTVHSVSEATQEPTLAPAA